MKIVGEARFWLEENLKNLFSAEELPEIQLLILQTITNLSQTQQHVFAEKQLTEAEIATLLLSVKKMQTGMPVQYVLGEADFFGLKLKVNPNVLIPRPETEELVAWILEKKGERMKGESRKTTAESRQQIAILDIGTGSGCIPIAIKKNWPEAVVAGLDISAEALQTAQENALLNQVEVAFFERDILNFYAVKEASKYSIIVSNPPYITPTEKILMHKNVLDFEPHLALFVPEIDPLLFYRKIADYASLTLQTNGLLFFEINENYGQQLIKLLQEKGFTGIELRKDFRGKERMIKALKA